MTLNGSYRIASEPAGGARPVVPLLILAVGIVFVTAGICFILPHWRGEYCGMTVGREIELERAAGRDLFHVTLTDEYAGDYVVAAIDKEESFVKLGMYGTVFGEDDRRVVAEVWIPFHAVGRVTEVRSFQTSE